MKVPNFQLFVHFQIKILEVNKIVSLEIPNFENDKSVQLKIENVELFLNL